MLVQETHIVKVSLPYLAVPVRLVDVPENVHLGLHLLNRIQQRLTPSA